MKLGEDASGLSGDAPSDKSLLGDVALAWLSQDPRARMIVSDTLELLWANAAARHVLAGSGGLSVVGGRCLHFDDPGAAGRFASFIRDTAETMTTLAIAFSRPPGHYLFRGWRLACNEPPLSCLELSLDTEEFASHYSDFDRVFGLTPAEHGVVVEIMDGRSAAEIAARHRISIVTVRSHIKKIYVKIGVVSREQLFGRLRPFRIF